MKEAAKYDDGQEYDVVPGPPSCLRYRHYSIVPHPCHASIFRRERIVGVRAVFGSRSGAPRWVLLSLSHASKNLHGPACESDATRGNNA